MVERVITKSQEFIIERELRKAYYMASWIWEKRGLLPVTHKRDCERIPGVSALRIPLVNEDFLELGRFGSEPGGAETLYIEALIHNKHGRARRLGTNLTSVFPSQFGGVEGYDFWIFFDHPGDENQVKMIKYLAGFNPVKKIDWDRIRPGTEVMDIVLSMSQAAFEVQTRRKGRK